MAKNTMPRNIPLEAVCDLGATQKVTDYEGFRGINSFNMNGRLCAWYRKKGDGIALSDTLTAKDGGDEFIIFDNGKEVMQVSKKKYVEEQVSELPSSTTSCANPYKLSGDSLDYEWTEYPGLTYQEMKGGCFIVGCEYNGRAATLITAKKTNGNYKCIFMQDMKVLGTWDAPHRINIIASSKDEFIPSTVLENPLYLYWSSWAEEDFVTRDSIPPSVETHFLKLNNMGMIEPDNRNLNSDNWSNIISAKIIAIGYKQIIFFRDGEWRYFNENAYNGMTVGIDSYGTQGLVVDILGNCPAIKTIKISKSNFCSVNFTSAESEIFDITLSSKKEKLKDYADVMDYDGDADIKDYRIVYASDEISFKVSLQDVCRIQSLQTLRPENFSKKFGTFAINYVKNTEYSIGHAYKKIIQLDEHELLGYTDDSVYYKNGGKIYRLHVVETDELDYSILDGNIIIFNTTDYKNAYDMAFGNVFCSSDDWNNRAQWKLKTYSENWRMLNSRLNQNWQTQRKIVGTSDQLSSVSQRIAVRTEGSTTVNDPSNMEIFYIDDSYTCPEGVEYDVFFESAITSSVGSLVKQGTLSTRGFTVAKDEGMIFSEPGTDENQLNLPILGSSFETYNGTTIIKVGDFSYTALKQTMLGNIVVPVYQFLEKGYSATDYAMFAINGTLYSYYPKTNQVTDSDGLFVCDTSTLVYLGYSTRAAYFYCKMDRGIYMFTGANEMQRCFAVEARTLVLAPFKAGSTNERGDTLNLPSLDLLVVNLGDGFAVLFGSQLCVVDSEERIGAGKMRLDKSRGVMQAGGYDWSLIKRDGYESVPIEFETQFYGDASGESNMVNDAVYFELTNYNGKSEGKITVQTVALVNGNVKEGAKKTISVGKSDFNKAGVARVRYQPDIQECRGFKLKVVSDFEIASMKIGCEAGALAQPKVRM